MKEFTEPRSESADQPPGGETRGKGDRAQGDVTLILHAHSQCQAYPGIDFIAVTAVTSTQPLVHGVNGEENGDTAAGRPEGTPRNDESPGLDALAGLRALPDRTGAEFSLWILGAIPGISPRWICAGTLVG